MKLIKFFLAAVGLVVIFLFCVNLFGNQALASGMAEILGTDVKVGKFHLDVLKSEVGIYDLKIKNLDGFKEDNIVNIPEIFIAVDFSKILKQTIVMREMRLNLDEVTLERDSSGKVNLLELKPVQQMMKGEGKEEDKPKQEDEDKPKPSPIKVEIQEAVLTVGQARYIDYSKDPVAVREFPLGINEAKLSKIKDTKHLIQLIIKKIMTKVGMNAVFSDWSQLSASLGMQWNTKVQEMKKGVGGLVDKIKGSFDKE